MDRDLQMFNPMLPTGAYFGQFSPIGPLNHRGLHPSMELTLARSVIVMLNWVLYWRHSTQDAVYGIPRTVVRTGQTSHARYVVRWQLDRHTGFQLNYARFLTGRLLAETPPARDTTYFSLWMTY